MPLLSALIPLLLLAALILTAALHGLAASGHFPLQPKALASGAGAVLLFGSMALVAVSLVGGIVCALRLVPWYSAIIGGGIALLAAPLVLAWFPDRFVDGRGALVTFAAASVILAILLLWPVTGS